MNYVSTYRKYRPLTFDDVVGQEHIVTTLKNAIDNNKLAHAYLFNGPRGTGKTSIAKIFARQINCDCTDNSCRVCSLNVEDTISDIIEMDAASNNSVDEIRKIVESVNYVPLELKYKVYIIDEVHMLSKSAFNALLKTIEEPPQHVKFILATTEINKIPLTIVSRTQRFDFKKISNSDICSRLEFVLNSENIEYEKSALEKIANLADGGLRDSLSLLDKIIMFAGVVTIESVNCSLNLVDDDLKEQLLHAIYKRDSSQVIKLIQNINDTGIDEYNFVVDFQYYVRNTLIDVIEMTNLTYNRNILINYLKQLMELQTRLLHTRNYKLLIEVYLLELCSSDLLPTFKNVELETKTEINEPVVEINEPSIDDSNQDENFDNIEVEVEFSSDSEDYNPDDYSSNEDYDNSIYNDDEQQTTSEIESSSLEELKQPEVMMDVLVSATKEYREELHLLFPKLVDECYSDNLRALARFFESAQLCAVSDNGCVVSLETELVKIFNERLETINNYLSEKLEKPMSTFIISFDDWNANKLKYAQTVKELRSSHDIYGKAVEMFGSDIVKKI